MHPWLKLLVGDAPYLGRCAERTRAFLDFARSDEFYAHILIGSLSSIPRWRYASVLEEVDRAHGPTKSEEAPISPHGGTRGAIIGEISLLGNTINNG